MKNIYYILTFVIITSLLSCSSSQSFNNFYNNHKNDNNVSSFQVPSYLRSLLKNASPELNDIFKNVKDFKSISFTDCSPDQSQQINDEINMITKNYTDVLRKNTEEKKSLVSVKEKGDVIKEVIIHNNRNNNHTILFLKGNFDPERIQKLANANELEDLYDIDL